MLLFLIYLFCNDSCQTSYHRIYWTDFRQILRVILMAEDDQSEISFRSLGKRGLGAV